MKQISLANMNPDVTPDVMLLQMEMAKEKQDTTDI
jgi:hypothetical protein